MVCKNCQLCGREGQADLVCSWILADGEVTEACWCVCKDCRQHLEDRVWSVYRELLGM
ncbi:hypothetical protein [Carboxydocella sp. ULO1]|uniref:hypothetical protein n=1 Tax=Carboxydocella sp. ULO1 TaxID=1926599 RepID=UPI00190EA739|nr:hypothetical protein [Carboxydocella sp. ULO1]